MPSEKLNKRKSITFVETPAEKTNENAMDVEKDITESNVDAVIDEQEEVADLMMKVCRMVFNAH